MRKVYLNIIFIFLISCAEKDWKEIHYPNGNVKVRVQLDKDGIPNGIHEEFFESGKLKLRSTSTNGKLLDTVKVYSQDGYLKEKGLMRNGLKDSWWSELDKKGNKYIDREYVIKNNDTILENQIKKYKDNGELDLTSSWFFNVKVEDSLSNGKLNGKVTYHSNFKPEDQFLYMVVNKDTFYGRNNEISFSVKIENQDTIQLSGEIFEEVLAVEKINDTLSSLKQETYNKYFKQKFIVVDSVVSKTRDLKKLRYL
ncbi:toxin-antitoxin system YwqK family antitoxin [Dokdonia sp. Hel_I_53]|uniref:toxin-antitoxin system YwqK family antitoxin n=1 Tax=Dokdonia sp. Hel_I_53 TaxID=1566287 RepID=UPI001199DE7F|nr:hypothetical protein [Dokdonia sp. Hel_I_53]TVZ52276.1 hypothetical protein OD90_1446 [Dokdonia sp. Hel_I_53]